MNLEGDAREADVAAEIADECNMRRCFPNEAEQLALMRGATAAQRIMRSCAASMNRARAAIDDQLQQLREAAQISARTTELALSRVEHALAILEDAERSDDVHASTLCRAIRHALTNSGASS